MKPIPFLTEEEIQKLQEAGLVWLSWPAIFEKSWAKIRLSLAAR